MKKIFMVAALLCAAFWGVALHSAEVERPILRESHSQVSSIYVPNEQRSLEYARLLSVSLKINVDGASGSGTICYYDESSEFAYVISCGHLWNGNMHYEHSGKRPNAKVVSWYKNSIKLDSPETFDAEVLFWSNDRGYDVSLLRFKPDWVPECSPIDVGFSAEPGMVMNSMGCDGGKEVARYEVVIKEFVAPDLITNKNSPRPGRSGGGLINKEGKLVGVCWGTSDISSGGGIGYFTPISSIKNVFEKNGHGWLLKDHGPRSLPIVDKEYPDRKYDPDFIPLPMTPVLGG